MNLILLNKDDFVEERTVELNGRRLKHIREIHKASVGESLRVGLENSHIGSGKIISSDNQKVKMQVSLQEEPPAALKLTMVLALPRPLMLKRILFTLASLGVKEIYLINTKKVEKSFWKSHMLDAQNMRQEMVLGLEQACDTVMPKVYIREKFKPFVEDELPELIADSLPLLADKDADEEFPAKVCAPVTVAIGPEGGLIPYETEKFVDIGFKPVYLGRRTLRVETMVPAAVARII